MMSNLLSLAYDFTVISLFCILSSAVIYACCRLVVRFFPEAISWREFWIVALVCSVATIFYFLIPNSVVETRLFNLSPIVFHMDHHAASEAIGPLTQAVGVTLGPLEYATLVWSFIILTGCFIALLRTIKNYRRLGQLVENSVDVSRCSDRFDSHSLRKLNKIGKRYSLTVTITREPVSPFIAMVPRPYMVFSEMALQTLSPKELDLVIRHELIHLKRKDYWLNSLSRLLASCLWFNPFVAKLNQYLNLAVESSCDLAVISKQPNLRRTYAQAMVKVLRGSATSDANQVVAAFSSKIHRSITMRINCILKPSVPRIKTSIKKAALVVFGLGFSSLSLSFYPVQAPSEMAPVLKMGHPVPEARVTAKYGANNKLHKFHKGIDLAAPTGTKVIAAAAGKVVTATTQLEGFKNYGTIIVIDHGNGIKSLYSHLNALNVAEGYRVEAGDVIGFVGETGRTTGPHVHFEVLSDDKRVNPSRFISF